MAGLLDLFLTFARIGAFTFGGGYAMVPLIESECVEKKGWMTADELTDLLVIAESTPGPIAINCSTYTGYSQKGLPGAAAATFGMVLPSFLIIMLISTFFEQLLTYDIVVKAFAGIRVAVALLISRVAIKMMRKMITGMKGERLKCAVSVTFAAVFFAAVMILEFTGISFSAIYLIIIAGILGLTVFSPIKSGVTCEREESADAGAYEDGGAK